MPSDVVFSGPLFHGDIGRIVDRAVEGLVDDLAEAALDGVKSELRPGHGVDTGAFEASLRIARRGDEATVYSPDAGVASWLEGTSSRNRTTSFKGYQPFAHGAERANRDAGRIGDKHAGRLADQLGGA